MCLSAGARAAGADVYTVAPGTPDASTVTACTATGTGAFSCANVRSAIAAAEQDSGSTVQLSAGIYPVSTGQLTITQGTFTIAGAGSAQTTLAQHAASRVVRVDAPASVTLSGLTVTGGVQLTVTSACIGSPEAEGGGILNLGTLTLTDVDVSLNKAIGADGSATGEQGISASGGGICNAGSLTMLSSTVDGNLAKGGAGAAGSGTDSGAEGGFGYGGGIANSSTGTLAIHNSTVSENEAVGGAGGTVTGSGVGGIGGSGWGGGIQDNGNPNSVTSISGSRITGNEARGGSAPDSPQASGQTGGYAFGGAMQLLGPASISGSAISGNIALGGDGGGGHGSGNHAGPGGTAQGGVEAQGPLTVATSSFTDNTVTSGAPGPATAGASPEPAGQAVAGALAYDSVTTIQSSTFAGNRAAAPPGATGSQVFGGAIEIGAKSSIVNTTIVGNTAMAGAGAQVQGGGVMFFDGHTSLASVTIAGNAASSATGDAKGGNVEIASSPLTARDTVIAAGTSSGTAANCDGTISTDDGHNLESTTPSQCGLSAAAGDLIGIDPLLAPLADNGGPTETMALEPTSPAIGAGGQCADPTMGGQPLATDQRGEPRATPCDIGAFEVQPPAIAAAPSIVGTPAVGSTLTCHPGSATGDTPLTTSYAWQRDGAAIAGANTTVYTVTLTDATHQLTCAVTQTNPYGHATETSAAVSVPYPPPTLGPLHQTHKRWREGSKPATLSAKRAPVGTTFTTTLSVPATLTMSFGHNHATLTLAAKHAGTIRVHFDGRLAQHQRLRPGKHTLRVVASDQGGRSSPRSIRFTIVPG
jgi:hypothetical protein